MIRVPLTKVKYALTGCYGGVWGDEPNGFDEIVVVRVADFDRTKGVVRVSEASTKRTVLVSHRNNRVLNRGDLLLEKSGGGEVTPVGSVVRFDYDSPAVSSNFIARLPVKRSADSRYLAYVFQDLFSRGVNEAHIKQTSGIQNIDVSSYLCERAWLPNSGTQRDVANYLDAKTAAIDALIAKKEELLAVLDRYRQAVIAKAVTKGLDDNVELVDSGVDWLGLVPKHWAVKKTQQAFTREKELNTGMRCCNRLALTLKGVVPRSLEDADGLQSSDYGTYQIVQANDIIFKLIDLANVNTSRVGLVPAEGIVSPVYIRLSARNAAVYPRFAYYWFYFMYLAQVFNQMGAGIRQALSADDLLKLPIALPSPEEQLAIVQNIDAKLESQKVLIAHTQAAIELLKKYRASVISAAVTGKSQAALA